MKAALLRRVILPTWQHVRRQNGFQLLRDLEQSQWLSAGEIEELQWRRISDLLEHAYSHVPYYSEALRQAGVNPRSLVRERSLAALPLLDRATIADRRDTLRADNFPPERFVPNRTGGSTGEPLRFYDDREGLEWSTAAVWRAQRWLGIDVGERCAYLWGADFDMTSFRSVGGRVKSGMLNMLMLPAWELSVSSAPVFWKQLQTFKPKLLIGYAGALNQMASLIGVDRDPIPDIRAIVVSAEVLSDEMRTNIEACFKVPVYNRYGGRDIKFVAQECAARRGLHISAENVLVEIVKDGRPVRPGALGEIVVTRLDNYAMPFVRYRSGDLGVLAEAPCTCGRSLPLLQELEGRIADAIVTADGRVISGLFFAHLLKDCLDVQAFQVHQTSLQQLLIVVVPAAASEFSSGPRVERLVRHHVGTGMRIEFEVRDHIPLTSSGKRRIVVSHLTSPGVRPALDGPRQPI